MDFQSNSQPEYGRFEQIVSQFLLKSLHIVLDSRVPSIRPHRSGDASSGAVQAKRSDKWFGLVLGDRPASLDNLNFWHRNLMEPMIIDIILVQEGPNLSSVHNSCSNLGMGKSVETVIERWTVQYEYIRTMHTQFGESSASYKKTYKKLIILLRSLYSMMRLLPAHRAFRKLTSSSQAYDFDINYKVSSFSAPFSRAEEGLMKPRPVLSVDAPQGRLSISVTYRESLSDFNLETSALFPAQIITDYVGSPATDPLRAFRSTGKSVQATSFQLRETRPPSSAPFQRPHSWTSGLNWGSPLAQNQPLYGSPPARRTSTVSYDFTPSPTDTYSQKSYRLPTHHNATSFDEYQLSPPFSSSPSPSPPTYLSRGNPMQTRPHSETAPLSIPHPMMGRSPRYLSPNFSDPNRHSLPPLSPKSTRPDPSSQDSPSGSRLFKISESLRAGELNSGIANHYYSQKMLKDSKDDSGRFSGLLSSSGSPRIGFSRSSSRLSFQDDLDDCDFSCPFIVDDVDTSDSPFSQNLDEKKASEFTSQPFTAVRKSQDAAVGALVHMLRTAPPLRQDSSYYSPHASKIEPEGEVGATSSFFLPRKTSDALEELRRFREMKDLLLSKSRTWVDGKEAA
ncbi:autophagy-related protein 13a-like [Cornus florida]|uniref:autophagy-related protein 13a-like n=1 Tax=Cornus florida TaxID=4283 RepID=UPI00289FD0CC|nr:autophagy-related protein 13a-like [Cornus florida]XP_059628875.1 autophagy-related protein 13a-like [Cornus florida]